ncbi:hypothetical protein I79_008741 [Cricetulus griseus]|uniref:Uncharacterized protein n=1 Tax=Cricetulus griseus TaxID=10029 RepID=G3HDX3_CRIGR|nr:hypothetical protein I79_008741 [Cricetulus griseus]
MTSSYQMGSGTITAGSCGEDLKHSSGLWGQSCLRPPTPAVTFMLTQEPGVSQSCGACMDCIRKTFKL